MKRFKLLAVFSICLISLFALSVSSNAVHGDVNSDGIHSTDDARLALRYATGIDTLDPTQKAMADVVYDNLIDTNDAMEILRISAGISKAPDHIYTEWEPVKKPTCQESGTATCICLFCDKVFYGYLPPSDHTYSGGVCTVCGHFDDNPHVTYNDISVTFGDSSSILLNKLGTPQDKLSDYTTSLNKVEIYIYCSDYADLGVFTFIDDSLTQFYTNNSDNYITHIDAVYDLDTSVPAELPYIELSDEVAITQYTDTHATDGEYVYSYLATVGNEYAFYNFADRASSEKLIFHLTNGLRALHGMSSLKFCEKASTVAYNHSNDMATRNYFDHYSPEGTDPGNRLTAAGVQWISYGENIAAGYRDAYEISNAWYNSLGHRNNLLNPDHEYLGVGIARNPNSDYRYYGTQNFYTGM